MVEGDYVLVKSANLDGLVQAFGDDGDGDFWDRSDWKTQKNMLVKRGLLSR